MAHPLPGAVQLELQVGEAIRMLTPGEAAWDVEGDAFWWCDADAITGWWLSVLLGCSLSGLPMPKPRPADVPVAAGDGSDPSGAFRGDRVGVCVESRRANNLVLDLLPALQLHRPGLNHAALQDRILLGFDQC